MQLVSFLLMHLEIQVMMSLLHNDVTQSKNRQSKSTSFWTSKSTNGLNNPIKRSREILKSELPLYSYDTHSRYTNRILDIIRQALYADIGRMIWYHAKFNDVMSNLNSSPVSTVVKSPKHFLWKERHFVLTKISSERRWWGGVPPVHVLWLIDCSLVARVLAPLEWTPHQSCWCLVAIAEGREGNITNGALL